MTPNPNHLEIIPAQVWYGKRRIHTVLAKCRVDASLKAELLTNNEERKLLKTFKTAKRRSEFIAGRRAAHHAIEELFGPEASAAAILPGLMGEPVLRGASAGNIDISISHSGPWALAFASEAGFPVTIDIEQLNQKRRAALAEVLTRKEKLLFSDYTVAFSAKEALGKFLRCGFEASWQIFELSARKITDAGTEIRFKHFPAIRVLSLTAVNFVVSFAAHSDLKLKIDAKTLAQALKDH